GSVAVPSMASLCRRKRFHASRLGESGLAARPSPPIDDASSTPVPTTGTTGGALSRSVNANPGVEPGVGQVGQEVEDDDEDHDDHHPRQHPSVVAGLERADEILP